jgi:hypothetical protein
MATANIIGPVGSNLGALGALLTAGDVWTASGPDYQLCKDIYLFHPLGAKIAEKPIELAQSQKREIAVPGARTANDKVVAEFEKVWNAHDADNVIFQATSQSRVYGAAVVAMREDGVDPAKAVDFAKLHEKKIVFYIYDPLNVSGSLVLDQNPLSATFMQITEVAVSGQGYHRSRCRVVMNENPIYISYTNSAYGYVGRSVYQRALLPLKSFVQTMITNDMISVKAGVIIAKIKQAGAIINQAARRLLGMKRDVVKEAKVGNVISIGTDNEAIESINFQNLEGPFNQARKNILEDIASAVPMPAQMLTEESFGSSMREGTEDSRAQARFVDRMREKMQPQYDWMDRIIMRKAWTPEFFKTMQAEFPDEFKDVEFEQFFWSCANSFKAQWPSFMKEPDSELIKVDDVKLRAIIAWCEVLFPLLPPDQKAEVIKWANDEFNNLRLLFSSTLMLDYEEIAAYEPPKAEGGFGGPDARNDAVEEFRKAAKAFIDQGGLKVVK